MNSESKDQTTSPNNPVEERVRNLVAREFPVVVRPLVQTRALRMDHSGSTTNYNELLDSWFCSPSRMLDVCSSVRMGQDGSVEFKLTDFVCLERPQPGMSFDVIAPPAFVFATARSDSAVHLTSQVKVHKGDVLIKLFAWNAAGTAVPDAIVDWRCCVQLAQVKLAYHLDYTLPRTMQPLRLDLFQAGRSGLIDSGFPGSDPRYSLESDPSRFSNDGLQVSIVRPIGAPTGENIGAWVGIPLDLGPEQLPDTLLLVASFDRPKQTPLSDQFVDGTFAASLLMDNAGTLGGVTCQFTVDGVRMNLPQTGITTRRPFIAQALADRILSETFTLALLVDRTTNPVAGVGYLYVEDNNVDSHPFEFANFSPGTGIGRIQAGIGTVSGEGYRASVHLLSLQIWVDQSYIPPSGL